MYKATTHECYTENYVLKISDFHCKSPIKFNMTNANEIRFETTDEDIENYMLRGFIDITNYMNKRYKDKPIDIM